MRQTSVAQLFEYHRERLQLGWRCGSRETQIRSPGGLLVPADLVGYLNLIHPDRMQVLGRSEVEWAERQNPAKLEHLFADIISARPPALIVADGCEVPGMVEPACAAQIPVLQTPQPASAVIEMLRIYLARELADTVEVHGVLMDVLGMGVMITGASGVGKSELALELISRGHGLVADDVVELARVAPKTLEGRCPEMLRHFLEVRGLGLLNVRTIFGETACRRKIKVNLVVHLQRIEHGQPEGPRLPLDACSEEILGVSVHKIVIPVAPGRNLAVLLEAAVRSAILMFRGIDSTAEFVERHKRALDADGS
ncbi:MAG TPA: HPr kinase/phosphorylase [Rhodocyclaceae bacterium]|nr:MAG: HPr kinase/phosphorylase [Betaproteobacteria bacterium CG2_30_68_42]PIV71934.1 MAG: HPr kinase/phosphorylase [Rhodocyclales bacterium CG17_big_fil_post_rev_8_21_14_2_50_68_7]PJA58843.1 MAG: HPr kinase/phosphorylase [Rhodocyclales bacterium CG_4_9_14_3_um_filter_68_10]HCX32311.1 HPr kinase/phosphorylase [Rhodocyclaceae bacterium]